MTALRLAPFVCLLMFWYAGLAQEKSTMREIIGSFRFGDDIYTYKCQVSKNGAALSTRKITNISSADTSLRASLTIIRKTLTDQLIQWGGNATDPLIGRSATIINEIDTLYKKLTR